jgi:hypothetical protein
MFCTHLCYHHVFLVLCALREHCTFKRAWEGQPDKITSDYVPVCLR